MKWFIVIHCFLLFPSTKPLMLQESHSNMMRSKCCCPVAEAKSSVAIACGRLRMMMIVGASHFSSCRYYINMSNVCPEMDVGKIRYGQKSEHMESLLE